VTHMTIETILEDERWDAVELDALAQRAIPIALHMVGLDADGYEVSLLGCDDARIAALNADFRGKPQPTNVLSWPSDDLSPEIAGEQPDKPEPGTSEMPTELGDIAIAYETCEKEATSAGKPIGEHVTHLLVHGVLHLLGYDHIRDKDATLMESLEVQILALMGHADPYRID